MSKTYVNCHTHIFTGNHVPPWLARTFLPLGLYYLLSVRVVVFLIRSWYKGPVTWTKRKRYKNFTRRLYFFRAFIDRCFPLKAIVLATGIWLTLQVFYFTFIFCRNHDIPFPDLCDWVKSGFTWLESKSLVLQAAGSGLRILLLLLLLLLFKPGRNLYLFVLRQVFTFLSKLPGKQTKDLLSRYVLLGRYASYGKQADIFEQLRDQYEPGTKFIVLPMDMAYMGAGRLRKGYCYGTQMAEIEKLLTGSMGPQVCPFVFVDPRRIEPGPGESVDPALEGAAFFDWEPSADGTSVTLRPCQIKTWIEEKGFRGFKIYPALGYYPFDVRLLPLWKYAADNGIPITTHCIRGTIFYRGAKKPAWDLHPVFKEADGIRKLLLPEEKAMDFSVNFTHPMNYLCLLKPALLAEVLNEAPDNVQKLFGWSAATSEPSVKNAAIERNLEHLKICLAHFGGNDEWARYLERDRDQYSKTLMNDPGNGIRFLTNKEGDERKGKPEQLWRYTDWYSIICSLMLQYTNVYADISYIVHDRAIFSLLKQTLRSGGISDQVLFGTDFYVVRNHQTEKCMWIDALAGLTIDEIDKIAVINPALFLSRAPA